MNKKYEEIIESMVIRHGKKIEDAVRRAKIKQGIIKPKLNK